MIDTMRFLIPIDEKIYKKMIKKSVAYIKKDMQEGTQSVRFHLKDVKLGSFNRNINIFIQSTGFVEIEFSIPKFHMGQNVFMVYPKDLRSILVNFRKLLINMFDDFPKVNTWIVNRLDLCYAWKLLDEETAYDVMNLLKTFSIPRKKRFDRDSSIMYYSDICSVKFYLKHQEFYKHDFIKLKEHNPDFAYKFFNYSLGVLRFEVELKHQALKNHFQREINYSAIDQETCEYLLNYHRDKFLRGHNPSIMSKEQAYQKLKEVYKPRHARTLFLFYLAYNGQPKVIQNMLVDGYHSSSLSRNFADINKAGVGIPSDTVSQMYNLQIPSIYCTNQMTPAGGLPPEAGAPAVRGV